MKRKVALFVALTMTAATLISCGDNNTKQEPEVQSSQVETEENEQEVIDSQPQTAPTYATTSVAYEDGSQYFTGSAQCIQITDSEHPNLAKAVDKKFSEIVKGFNKTANEFVKEADEANDSNSLNEDVENDEDMVFNYSYYIYAEVTRADSQIFSVKLTQEIYTGGAHGSHVVDGYVFDSKTGELLSLEQMGVDSNVVRDFVLDTIESSDDSAKEMLFDEYKESIDTDFENPEDSLGIWLDNRGVVVAFQEYDIAPYAAGLVQFTVPYSQLSVFNKEYIPTEDSYYSFELSNLGLVERVDLDGDGQLEDMSLVCTYIPDNNGFSTYTLNVNDISSEIISGEKPDGYSYATAYFVHRKDGNFIMTSMSGEADIYLTKLYKYDAGKLREVGSEKLGVKNVTEEYVELAGSSEEMYDDGTAPKFEYDNTGFTEKEK